VQRQLLAGVGEAFGLAAFQLAVAQRLDAEGQAPVGLEGHEIVLAGGFDADYHLVTLHAAVHVLHRRGEVLHVRARAQPPGRSGLRTSSSRSLRGLARRVPRPSVRKAMKSCRPGGSTPIPPLAPRPLVFTYRTGVGNSFTSRRRRSDSGSWARENSMRMRPPC